MRCYRNYSKSGGKRSLVLFLVAAIILVACGGGSAGKAGGSSQAVFDISDGVEWRQNDICAIIFVGYGKDFASVSQADNYKMYCERFPSLRKAAKFAAVTEGDEVYYIIPRYSDATVVVNEYKIDIEDNMKEIVGKKLYEGEAAPLLIRCNLSDLHPNTSVTVTGGGKSVTFNPINAFGERNDVQFITSDGEFTDMAISKGFSSEHIYKGISAEIKAKLVNGKVLIFYDREEAVSIFGEADIVINDSYNVEGMSGACKGVFIGDVGQDYNPVLCCLMEDGGIEVLELYEALRSFDFRTSGRLSGYDNIVSVSNEGVQFGDGGGYVTLFTLDAAGNKKEIEFNVMLKGTWVYRTKFEEYDVTFNVYFSADWKITYVFGYVDSEALESYSGTCRVIEENDNTIVYGYEMKENDLSEMSGEAPDPTVKTGTLKVQKITDDWFEGVKINCLSGLKFHPGELGTEATFINKYRIDRDISED